MSVDFEAIAQRGRCDVSSLRLALPLLQQGYTPPFLARYRRDELGGLDESSLWALSSAMHIERQVAARRDELHQAWERTTLRDPAIGHAIKKSHSLRMLARLGRRLKSETAGDMTTDAMRLAVRVLNPRKGDGSDFADIAANVDGITDPAASVATLDAALAKRLAGDPRIIAAAVRWLVKHARIHITSISDPHTSGGEEPAQDATGQQPQTPHKPDARQPSDAHVEASSSEASSSEASSTEASSSEASPAEASPSQASPSQASPSQASSPVAETAEAPPPSSIETTPPQAAQSEAASQELPVTSGTPAREPTGSTSADELTAAPKTPPSPPTGSTDSNSPETDSAQPGSTEPVSDSPATEPGSPSAPPAVKEKVGAKQAPSPKPKSPPKAAKKQKKISPRQRRRRWLVGVLKPLEGKRLSCDKLSSFQIVMLGRALRSQVAQCSFQYDATKLVGELQRVAAGINRHVESLLRKIVLDNEASIREAAEAAWWDDLHERASARLVTITADHLRKHVNRGAVQARVVMAIDAIGPRTAATSIVSADGQLLHNEDLPCQLSAALRSQAVARMGELIHHYHVDLLIISNGPARRASMIALSDLIAQSPEKSVRWTVADRSGADAYASSGVANQEMRSTPRRFRAAAWLAFSVLQPAQALAKVDPLKLRLSSFQRELSDDAIRSSLENVMISGASRGGVDVNSAPVAWLARLPGMTAKIAESIDAARRNALFDSRQSLAEIGEWETAIQRRQALPFLRVFGSQEVLDGTLIHPEDYALANRLATALEIELPPDAPPGYRSPEFSADTRPAEPKGLSEVEQDTERAEVKDFSSAGDQAPEFAVDSATEETAEIGPPSETTEAHADADSQRPEPSEMTAAADPSQQPEQTTEADTPPTETSVSSQTDATDAGESSAPTPAEAEGGSTQPDGPSDPTTPTQDSPEQASSASPNADAASQPAVGSTLAVKIDIPEPIKRPQPDKSKIDKCIKEWQIGARRAHQMVQWLCDPFGDSDSTGDPPAVLTTMPSMKTLKPGDKVIGVIVGVMPFGVFVELAPDCSGLIHVSRASDSFIEDLHEALQVGDVITAWVTGIDEKRRRVALSAVSPARQAELEEARRHRDDHARQGGYRRGGRRDSGPARGQSRGKEPRSATPTAQPSSRGHDAGRGKEHSRGKNQGQRGGSRESGRGGRSRERSGGKRREKKPESYRVVSKQEAKPITDAMQKGEEPLRSFGDLMQFFDQSKTEPDKPQPEQPDSSPQASAETSDATPQVPSDEAPAAEDTVPTSSTESAAQPDPATTPPEQSSPPQADQATPPQTPEPTPPQAAESDPSQVEASDSPQANTDTTTDPDKAGGDPPASEKSSSPADASAS